MTSKNTDYHGVEVPQDGYDQADPSYADLYEGAFDDLEAKIKLSGLIADRPSSDNAPPDAWFEATDQGLIYRNASNGWVVIGGTGSENNPLPEQHVQSLSTDDLVAQSATIDEYASPGSDHNPSGDHTYPMTKYRAGFFTSNNSPGWSRALRLTHDGQINASIALSMTFAGDDIGGGSTVNESSTWVSANYDNDWGTTGATENITSNVRFHVDPSDSSIAYIEINLDGEYTFGQFICDITAYRGEVETLTI